MLTCSVTGVPNSDTTITAVWVDEQGALYNGSSSKTDYSVTDQVMLGDGKRSTLTLSENVTSAGQDRTFTCRVTVGAETEPADLEISLKTFAVQVKEAQVKLGESATLTCLVIDPSDTLNITWYLYAEDQVEGIPKLTISEGTTTSELVLENPTNDAIYTCQVSGKNTYTFDVALVINDVALNPEGQIRAFPGTIVTMTCSFMTTTISEGSFYWKLNGQACTTYDCRNTIDSPKSSTLAITVANNTAGEWECSFTKRKQNRTIRSSPLQLINVDRSGRQNPVSLWGRVGEEAEVFCTVPHGLNYSTLSTIEWTLNGNLITKAGLAASNGYRKPIFSFGDETESATEFVWSIMFSFSTATEGELQCEASYKYSCQLDDHNFQRRHSAHNPQFRI